MRLNNLVDTWKKKLAIGALVIATGVGTYSGIDGGCPPLYNKKSGTSYGINIGLVTEFMPGSKFYGLNLSGGTIGSIEFYGLNLSITTTYTDSKINGASISGAQGSSNKNHNFNTIINGLEVGLINVDMCDSVDLIINGLQIGMFNSAKSGYFAQIGLFNKARVDLANHGNFGQVGIINVVTKEAPPDQYSFILGLGIARK